MTENIDSKVHFIRSQKKNAQLVYKHCIFNKKITQINGHTTWRCAEMAKKCRALVTTKDGKLIRMRDGHNHVDHKEKLVRRVLYEVEDEMEEYIEMEPTNSKICEMLDVVDMGNDFKLVVQNTVID